MDASVVGLKFSMPKVTLKHPLKDVRQSVVSSQSNLVFLGEKYGVAIWRVGNCLIIAEEPVSGRTVVQLINYKLTPPDGDACEGWNHVANFWVSVEWLDKLVPCVVAEQAPDWITKALRYLEEPDQYKSEWKVDTMTMGLVPSSNIIVEEWQRHLQQLEPWFASAHQVQNARAEAASKTAESAAGEYWTVLEKSWLSSGGAENPQSSQPIQGPTFNFAGDMNILNTGAGSQIGQATVGSNTSQIGTFQDNKTETNSEAELPNKHFDFDASCEEVLTLFAGEQSSQTQDLNYGGDVVQVTTVQATVQGGNWCVMFRLKWQDPGIYDSLIMSLNALEQNYAQNFVLIQAHKNQLESLKGREVSAINFAASMTVAMIELEPRGRNECHATLRFLPDKQHDQIAYPLQGWREMVYRQSQDIVADIWRKTLAEWQKQLPVRDDSKTNPNTILHKLDQIHSDLGSKLDNIQQSQSLIYARIGTQEQTAVDLILTEVRAQSISQGEMQRTLDAIRRVLKHVQQKGLPVDPETKKSLDEIYNAINSDIGFSQQLQLSLPVIPFLLSYSVTLDAGVDLGGVWKELIERVQKNKQDELTGDNKTETKTSGDTSEPPAS